MLYAAGANTPVDCKAGTPFTTSNYHNQFAGSFNPVQLASAASPAVVRRSDTSVSKSSSREKIWKQHTPISFEEAETTSRPHPTLPDVEVKSTTYFSTPIPLASGQIAWTYPEVTPIDMPTGKYALLAVHDAEIVDCYNKSIPLSEVYNHHVCRPSRTHPHKRASPTPLFVSLRLGVHPVTFFVVFSNVNPLGVPALCSGSSTPFQRTPTQRVVNLG
jgi:hypothetical protein